MPLAFGPDESHPMVDALLRTRVRRWRELNRAIDERDDMLDFAVRLFEYDRDRGLTSYFQDAIEQFDLVRHVASWRGPVRKMLDFASGYGRLTRFVVHEKLADDVTVSDILPHGMEFQAEQFGVRTVLSVPQPEDFEAPDRYDLIFVASLFTHLPAATFTRWLRRLAGMLEPEGLLAFSVHDQSIAPERVDGIHFTTTSESRVLDTSEYGSTWVTEEYVREQVATIGAGFACVRLPRALSEWQDVYVMSPAPLANARPRRMPKGFLETVESGDDGVRLAGWATVLEEPPDRIEVRLDDDLVAAVRHFAPRPDVAASIGDERATLSGWQCTIPHEAIRSFRYQVATVSAFSREGRERILYIGPLDSLHGHVARQRADELDRRRAALEQEIAAMRQSRFWRAREKWVAVRARLTKSAPSL